METKFIKEQFNYSGGYLTYGPDNQFVARFKHRGPITKAVFLTELIKNHTVEGYFGKLNGARLAPVRILQAKNPTWYDNRLGKFFAKLDAKHAKRYGTAPIYVGKN